MIVFCKNMYFLYFWMDRLKKQLIQVKYSNTSIGGDFFEGNLLLILDSINKKKFKLSSFEVKKIGKVQRGRAHTNL